MVNRLAGVIGSTVLVGAAAVMGASPADAASPDFNASKFCTDFGDFSGFFTSHGQCVRYFESNYSRNATDAVTFCANFLVPEGYYSSVGRCVSETRTYYH
jgi:hypothetical protein